MESRKLYTGCFSKKSNDILHFIIERINVSSSKKLRTIFNNTKILEEPNGETSWEVNFPYYYSYTRSAFDSKHNDKQVKEWIALTLKNFVKDYLSLYGGGTWNRNCQTVVDNLRGTTISEFYCFYEFILNRKNFKKHWSKEMIEKIVGTEKNAIETECEIARREEIERINERMKNAITEAHNERDRTIREMNAKAYAECNEKIKEIKKNFEKEIENLTASFNFINNVNNPFE